MRKWRKYRSSLQRFDNVDEPQEMVKYSTKLEKENRKLISFHYFHALEEMKEVCWREKTAQDGGCRRKLKDSRNDDK